MKVYSTGWITDTFKEECILRTEIQVADIIRECTKEEHKFNLKLYSESNNNNNNKTEENQ